MRASRAYITSLGTTGVLIASSILLLAVVSTIVAFRGWPGDDIVNGLGSLSVGEDQPTFKITGPAQIAADAAPAAAAVAATPPAGTAAAAAAGTASTPTPVQTGATAPVPGGVVQTPTPDTTGNQGNPGVRPPGSEQLPTTPPVSPVTGGAGRTTENLTGNLGNTVGGVNPTLGKTVSDTGKTVSQLVQGLGVTVDTGLGGPGR